MKLELKHLAGYLPYGLKTLTGWNNVEEIIGFKDETYFIKGGNVYAYGDIQDCKPILRPLSDLTKEREVNGLTYSFEDWVNESSAPDELEQYKKCIYEKLSDGSPIEMHYLSYRIIQKLYEWHFDIHRGIGTWAIDINTL